MKYRIGFFIAILTAAITASAQTTTFNYQGKLTDSGGLAASYDFTIHLCASSAANCDTGDGSLAFQNFNAIVVSNDGSFNLPINFGAALFDGSSRYLRILMRRNGQVTYTELTPRQEITSSPYAVQSLKATNTLQLGGVAANQYVLTTDTRLNAVQNTTTLQPGVNFNIGGTGNADIFDAATQYNIGGNRVLSIAGSGNVFAGRNAGANNAAGAVTDNSFFGMSSGLSNTIGSSNSFFGRSSGLNNQTGSQNSFFGRNAGLSNTIGSNNSFIGALAGQANVSGTSNSFFGNGSGLNSTGNSNTFVGNASGDTNTTGSNNTALGNNADIVFNNLINATAIGANSLAGASNSMVLGSINGVNGATADTKVGIGITAPTNKLHIYDPTNLGLRVENNSSGGTVASFGFRGSFQVDSPSAIGGRLSILENGNVGIGAATPLYKMEINDASNTGLRVRTNTAGGTVASFAANGAFQVDAVNVAGGRLTILENGNVGIGNTTPQAKLAITGSGSSSTALEINNGALKVTGAGINTQTPAFVYPVTAGNSCGTFIVIDNPYTNNDPNAILFITLSTGDDGVIGSSPQRVPFVRYFVTGSGACTGFNNRWYVNIPDRDASFPLRLNVLVIKP